MNISIQQPASAKLLGCVLWGLFVLLAPVAARSQLAYVTNASHTITITGYAGTNGTLVIPDSTNGLRVTAIADLAFESCTNLTSVIIPAGVTNLGIGVFYDCEALTNVSIPEGVTSIGSQEFSACFSLAMLTIPDHVTSLGDAAFNNCLSLTTMAIPAGVTNLGANVFISCASLTNISVAASNAFYASDAGVLLDKGLTTVIECPGGKAGCYAPPASVTAIGTYAFCGCAFLTNVPVPAGVVNLGDYAFNYCARLASVTLPVGVTSILKDTFAGCVSLTNIAIPAGVTSIGDYAFAGCSGLLGVTLPGSLETIGNYAFEFCPNLASLTMPAGVLGIGSDAFASCSNLTAIYFDGNAPAADSTVFVSDPGTVYYLPDSTGWSNSFGGLLTAPWPLPITIKSPGCSPPARGFGFTISAATNVSLVVVEACTDLAAAAWSPVQTNTLINGTNYFMDAKATNYPERFYRVQIP